MRTHVTITVLLVSCFALAGPAVAARLSIQDDVEMQNAAYNSQPIEQPWRTQRPETILVERPIADIVATRFGITTGSLQLFRYRLEDAPSSATMFYGQIDGGGIKLRFTW
jgi:hypothetical protein